MHLGFHRSSDEYKVMGLAGYGKPQFLEDFRKAIRVRNEGGFEIDEIDFSRYAPRRAEDDEFIGAHADLAASVQTRLEEVLLELARWVHARTGDRYLAMAGGVALNCVANARIAREGPYERIWVQPAAGDAGTSLGAALFAARKHGETVRPMTSAALGREWSDDQLARELDRAHVEYERPYDIASAVAEILADDGVVGWFQGRSEFGPRALGHRSLLANPKYPDNLERLNNIKGREQFRPVAPMVLADRAPEIFDGQLPSPYMLFTHRVKPEWRDAIAAAVHVDGTARVQTVDESEEPLVAQMLRHFDRLTGVPVVINTSFNTAGRPMVDAPRDALECFGSSPVDALAIGPFLLRRAGVFKARPTRREVASGV
jgi:carbamoyltransferase